uniref:MYB transcription factor n=1 Tax=Paeonia suffruticosa TaxID=45171 RepID=A0A7M3T7N2_PAESU|nr:MYB transcription factor [Paeonia suffruticosa]
MTKQTSNEGSKQKERHIVSWTDQEDDILRKEISIHGTENWTIIASKFNDKTTRQCRRRWYTYLNSDFKKGGWTPEEDMLLCEAQKIYGNRWTEIAKVVSGRTDNAVKNRFSTLCKKRAKHEALAKENSTPYINSNNKRVLFPNQPSTIGTFEAVGFKKMRRTHISDHTENRNHGCKLLGECETTTNEQQKRLPFAVLCQNFQNVGNLPTQHHVSNSVETSNDAAHDSKSRGTFLKKDDPKITALTQQAELLSSLAQKVSAENTDQSLENAWKVVHDFLNRTKESDTLKYEIPDMDFQNKDFKNLVEDLRSSNEGSQSSWRQPDLYEESPDNSEYSTGSTLLSYTRGDVTEQTQSEMCALQQDTGFGIQSIHSGELNGSSGFENGILSCATSNHAEFLSSFPEPNNNEGVVPAVSCTEFSSPLQVTPMFRSLAAGIPTPKFSESEKHFLMRAIGMEPNTPNPSTNPSSNPSEPPPCKRVLLHSL